MMQEILDIARQKLGEGEKEYKCGLDVFVEIYLVNAAPGKCNIVEYALEIEIDGEYKKLKWDRSFKGWILEKQESKLDDFGSSITEKTYLEGPDLGVYVGGKALEQRQGVEGWLHFVLDDVSFRQFDGIKHDLIFTVTDGFGKEHKINRAWTSNDRRPTKITWDMRK
jgi:hypothetical protein